MTVGTSFENRTALSDAPRGPFVTTQQAAEELVTTAHALRERIRRAARRVNGRHVADLGVIVFFKLGRSWRGRWTV